VKSSSFARTALAAAVFVVGALVFAACGSTSGTNQPSVTGTPRSTIAPATATAGTPTADGLCAVFTQDLALAALGGPVAAPTGGDVVPRPNGIYCHYALAGNANFNVDAQLKDMTRGEFDQSVQNFGVTEPLDGVGDVAYQLDHSTMGGPGAFVMAWQNNRRVTVLINSDGEQAQMLAAAAAIATKVLAQF
jgi:hypothetical protein